MIVGDGMMGWFTVPYSCTTPYEDALALALALFASHVSETGDRLPFSAFFALMYISEGVAQCGLLVLLALLPCFSSLSACVVSASLLAHQSFHDSLGCNQKRCMISGFTVFLHKGWTLDMVMTAIPQRKERWLAVGLA